MTISKKEGGKLQMRPYLSDLSVCCSQRFGDQQQLPTGNQPSSCGGYAMDPNEQWDVQSQ
jgi:hypothetical protein